MGDGRRRHDDSDRDMSDSGSESGGAFRTTGRDLDHPSPNISLGPPVPPMLPYLYPPSFYGGSPGIPPLGPPHSLSLSLFGAGSQHAAAASLPPSLLFNQLLQHQLLHRYPLGPPVSLASSIGPGNDLLQNSPSFTSSEAWVKGVSSLLQLYCRNA